MISLNALESVVLNRPTFDINVMLGYEITNAAGTHAYAILPFNIEVKS
jgi:hypothetical protein